jgi:hypothetical protein
MLSGTYEECRNLNVIILDMQISKLNLVSGYVLYLKKKFITKVLQNINIWNSTLSLERLTLW